MKTTEPRTVRVVCPECGGNWFQERIDGMVVRRCHHCDKGSIPATLLPLADGQMCVVEQEAWEEALHVLQSLVMDLAAAMRAPRHDGIWAESGDLSNILTALFGKAGIQVAEAVGKVTTRTVTDDDVPIAELDGPSVGFSRDISGRRVALLKEER